jgi:uncharacterized protein
VFRLEWHHGWHGIGHWSRVFINGRALAESVDVNPRIPAWFAFLHDSHRHDEGRDPHHGPRAARFAAALRDQGRIAGLSDREFDALHFAIAKHSDGMLGDDPIVQVCWDADRLDLGRVGAYPDRDYLSTALARSDAFLSRAYERSVGEKMTSPRQQEMRVADRHGG